MQTNDQSGVSANNACRKTRIEQVQWPRRRNAASKAGEGGEGRAEREVEMRLVARSAACGHIVAVSRRLAGTRTGPGDSVTDRLSPRSLRLHVSHGHSRPSTLRMLFAVKVKSIGCRRPNTVSSVVVFGTARVHPRGFSSPT